MDAKDWYECGAKIGDLVQSAIDSNNYKELNDAINDVINDTVDLVQKNIKKMAEPPRSPYSASRNYAGQYRSRGRAYQEAQEAANVQDPLQRAGSRSSSGMLKGTVSMAAGYTMAIICGLGFLAMEMLHAFTFFPFFRIGSIFLLILTAIFGIMGYRGGKYRDMQKRAEKYLAVCGDRGAVTVDELAAATGQSKKQVRKELKELIREGRFAADTYMDESGTTLIRGRDTYRQYQETMAAYQERMKQEEVRQETVEVRRREAEKNMSVYSEETRKILEEGQDFIRHIHECNDRIPEAEMSEKLDRLELVVTRIFEQVAEKPDSAPDLHRMMSYYLPVTRKLVDAYVELGDQRIQGENITKTRQEIRMSLDTINTAFESFLDSFYQDTAWDISSDIQAMQTMMARDGLTGQKDFAPGSHIKTVANDVSPSSGNRQSAVSGGSAAAASGGAAAMLREEQ